MTFTLSTAFVLPALLGFLGFIEPCTIGAHLIFLRTLTGRRPVEQFRSLAIFIVIRSVVAGGFGALVAVAGQRLIGVQTGLWLVFGLAYLVIGLVFLAGRAGAIKQKIELAPEAWKGGSNAMVLGLAFGLNIPACAAPILFGLLSLAASSGTALFGFGTMFVFGLFLSAPLVAVAFLPELSIKLQALVNWARQTRGFVGGVFVLLGLWSIWFGLFVDPANWTGT